MAKIENIDQLRLEISRLKKLSTEQEVQIKADLANVGEDMKPMNILLRSISGMIGIKVEKEVFMKNGVFYGASLLFQRLLLKAEKKAEDTVLNLVDVFFEKIQNFINRHTTADAKKEERKEKDL